MRKFTLAAALAALGLFLFATQPVAAQARHAGGPSFGQSFKQGLGFGLGRQAAFGLGRGGFYGGRLNSPFGFSRGFGLGGGGFYGGAAFRQSLFLRQSFYAAPLLVPVPVLAPQPLLIDESQAFLSAPLPLSAVSACGTLGLGAGYGCGSFGLAAGYGGYGRAPFRSFAPLRFRR